MLWIPPLCEHLSKASALSLLGLLLLYPHSAQAQNVEERAQRQAERIQREASQHLEEQWRREELERERPPLPSPDLSAPPVPPVPHNAPAGEGGCVTIHSFVLTGVGVMSIRTLEAAAAAFEGRCLALPDLNQVLETLTFLYVEAGYITARVYLPAQDLSDGVLELAVVEDIVLEEEPEQQRRLGTAFPGLRGRPLNLRDIEQGLDQLNRLRSVDARLELQAGERPGGTIVQVVTEQGPPVHLSVSADNLGESFTGDYQSRLSMEIDNPLRANDQWTLSYQRSMEDHPWNFSHQRPSADALSAAISLPYGFWSMSLGTTWSRYKAAIKGQLNNAIETSGSSQGVRAQLHRVMHRDQVSKTTLSGTLNWKTSRSYVLDQLIKTSSRTLTIAEVDFTHSRRIGSGWVVMALGHQVGLNWLGALDDSVAASGSPKGQFSKWTLRLGGTAPLQFGGVEFSYDGSITGQWSQDLLFGSEQMYIGGVSTVRGVREAQLVGNSALLLRNNWSLPAIAIGHPAVTVAPYVGLDCGVVFPQQELGIEGGSLCGAALGLRAHLRRLSLDMHYADTLSSAPDGGVLVLQLSATLPVGGPG